MATKITTAVFALIMGLSFNSFAGTPETKGEAKPETKPEATTVSNQSIPCYLDGTVYREKLSGGNCEEQPGAYCTYNYIGNSTPELDQDPTHYEVDTESAGFRWEP